MPHKRPNLRHLLPQAAKFFQQVRETCDRLWKTDRNFNCESSAIVNISRGQVSLLFHFHVTGLRRPVGGEPVPLNHIKTTPDIIPLYTLKYY